MKRRTKIILTLLGLIFISQLPFMYRRIRLGSLQKRIDDLNAERVPPLPPDGFTDYRGVIHVHSRLGGHSLGDPGTIIAAARKNRLAFVVMTEHGPPDSYGVNAALSGLHEGVLFIGGSEITAEDGGRLLVVPAVSPGLFHARSTQAAVSFARHRGQLVFIAYPEALPIGEIDGFNGIEVYDAHTQTRKVNRLQLFFDILWSYRPYANLLMTQLYFRPDENLANWDRLTAGGRRLTALAGVDAHANIGIVLHTQAGQRVGGILLDPYELTFKIARNYVVLESGRPLDTAALMAALEGGQIYTSFDLMADASGFRFAAENGAEKKIMGQEIPLRNGVTLKVVVPKYGRIVVLRDGQRFKEQSNVGSQEFKVHEKGVYRVEVYLDRLDKPLSDHPWILSNPIYVR